MAGTIAEFANTYSRLPERFFVRQDPEPVAQPRLLALNRPLAAELGLRLDGVDDEDLAQVFSGNRLLPGAEPLSMAYAGHQFGGFVPQLGDGRAILLGEVIDAHGRRRDIQLKGSGPTPFSRRGDGRAALGPVLREYLLSEGMRGLGVPATRALAAVATGQPVVRERVLPGAVLTRVAASHVRVGTFQYFAVRRDTEALRRLADFVIERHYPELAGDARPYPALLAAVARRQAQLIAHWMSLGFVHGVMNTDNMAVSGETIDFGPCAFLEAYDPQAVFSAIDEGGRYAYANQPHIAQWNIARLAEAMLPLLDADGDRAVDLANAVIEDFPARYDEHWLARMRAKLGLVTAQEDDRDLIGGLLDLMHAGRVDFTLGFRQLCDAAGSEDAGPGALAADPAAWDAWASLWRRRLGQEAAGPRERAAAMRLCNPAYIPRNHRVEQALDAAVEQGDMRAFERLLSVLQAPFEEQADASAYRQPALPEEQVLRTFCGT